MALKEVIKHVLNDESLEPEERDILVSWFLSDKGKEDFYEVLQEDSEQVQEDGNLNYNTLLQKIHDKIDPIPGRPEKKGIRKYLWPVASTGCRLTDVAELWPLFLYAHRYAPRGNDGRGNCRNIPRLQTSGTGIRRRNENGVG